MKDKLTTLIAWTWAELPPLVLLFICLRHGLMIESVALVLYIVGALIVVNYKK